MVDLNLRRPQDSSVMVPHLADVARLYISSMVLGTRYPYGRRSDSGANEQEMASGGPVKAALKR